VELAVRQTDARVLAAAALAEKVGLERKIVVVAAYMEAQTQTANRGVGALYVLSGRATPVSSHQHALEIFN
jgi:hypothetical protein